MVESRVPVFEYDLKTRFSLARDVAIIALSSDLSIPERGVIAYPPALTIREMAGQFFINRRPTMTQDEEQSLRGELSERLTVWAEEGSFQLLPVSGGSEADRVAYRITNAGAAIAIAEITAHSTRLDQLAGNAQARLGSSK